MGVNKILVNSNEIKDYHRHLTDCWYQVLDQRYESFDFDSTTMIGYDKSYIGPQGGIYPFESDLGICVSIFFEVEPNSTIIIIDTYLNSWNYFAYNSKQQLIGQIPLQYDTNAPNGSFLDYMMFKIPSNCYYFRGNVIYGEIDGKSFKNHYIIIPPEKTPQIINNYVITQSSNILQRPFEYGSGKLLLAFGDSITQGIASTSSYAEGNITNPSTARTYTYITRLAEILDIGLYNAGSSAAMCTEHKSDHMPYLLDLINGASPSKTPDIITLMIGVNDYFHHNTDLGSPDSGTDENLYYPQLNKAVKRIKERWTSSKLIIISPISCYTLRDVPIENFRQANRYVAAINNVSYIDGKNCGIPPEKQNEYSENILITDTVHPTSLGHKTIGESLAGLIV